MSYLTDDPSTWPEWPDLGMIERGMERLKQRLVFEHGRACSLAEQNSRLRHELATLKAETAAREGAAQ